MSLGFTNRRSAALLGDSRPSEQSGAAAECWQDARAILIPQNRVFQPVQQAAGVFHEVAFGLFGELSQTYACFSVQGRHVNTGKLLPVVVSITQSRLPFVALGAPSSMRKGWPTRRRSCVRRNVEHPLRKQRSAADPRMDPRTE